MVETFEPDIHEESIARSLATWSQAEGSSAVQRIQAMHDTQAEEVPNPEDFYDMPQSAIEAKETFEPLKVYEITNIADVGFGTNSLTTEDLSFTVNWPLFGKDNQPVGWYIAPVKEEEEKRENEKKSPKVKDFINPASLPPEEQWNFAVDNWIFWLDEDWALHLIPYDERNDDIDFTRAFQNWPILLLDGENRRNPESTSRYSRSGIWFTPEWRAFVIYSDEPVTFYEFAELFKKQGCTNAIYLDGNIAAGYEDKTGSHGQLDKDAIKLQFFHQK